MSLAYIRISLSQGVPKRISSIVAWKRPWIALFRVSMEEVSNEIDIDKESKDRQTNVREK